MPYMPFVFNKKFDVIMQLQYVACVIMCNGISGLCKSFSTHASNEIRLNMINMPPWLILNPIFRVDVYNIIF